MEGIQKWEPDKAYKLGDIVMFAGKYFRVTRTDKSGTTSGINPFEDESKWYWSQTTTPSFMKEPIKLEKILPQETVEKVAEPAKESLKRTPLVGPIMAKDFSMWVEAALSDVPDKYNVINLSHVLPLPSGSFKFEYAKNITPDQVYSSQVRGQRVCVVVTCTNNGFNLSSRSQSNEFLSSFAQLTREFDRIDGCHFNNFQEFNGFSPEECAYVAHELKENYGQDFLVTIGIRPYSGTAPRDTQLAIAVAKSVDYVFIKSHDVDTESVVLVAMIDEWCDRIGEEKIVVSLNSRYAHTQAVIAELMKLFPKLGGFNTWSE